ncbi:MAG TPA: histidine kinase [Acidimicrobiia bacterium]|nr:histidine kinase [Acidimicrobiia bacterium]
MIVTRSDWLVVGGLLALGSFGMFLVHDLQPEEAASMLPMWGDYLALALLVLPLLARRTAPLVVGLVVGLGFTAFRLLRVPEGSMSSVAVFVALYAVGAYAADRVRRDAVRGVVVGAGMVALVVSLMRDSDFVSLDAVTFVVFSLGLNVAFFVAAWMLGDASRRRGEYEEELQRRADELAAEREERARRAVTEERVRIARELHDVVAHHVAVMGVQAAAARLALGRDPSGAAAALGNVEESGRQAVGELQQLVGYLRSENDDDRLAPQPTLDDLPALLGSTRAAGVPVDVRVVGKRRRLPSSLELSAFRIVQEALTNVVRHAPGAATTVVLSHLADSLQVEVVNDRPRPGAARSGPGGGRGLVGMRERTSVLGGTLAYGPLPGGGYRVVARLPVHSSYEGFE